MPDNTLEEKIKKLPFWTSSIEIEALHGGMTNLNFLVSCEEKKYVVRSGEDIPLHHVMRFNELAASKAAYRAGLSPAVLYSENGLTILEYIESTTFDSEAVRDPANLPRVVALIKQCHQSLAQHLRGPALSFWIFHIIRDYAKILQRSDSAYKDQLQKFVAISDALEQEAGPYTLAYCHNDLLAANFLDDGKRLWLIDWDYAGMNSPLFDLGGLASNNDFSAEEEHQMLELYYAEKPSKQLLKQFSAMKCASLLRETLWSMVSEQHSNIDFDYSEYTKSNLQRFEQALHTHQQNKTS